MAVFSNTAMLVGNMGQKMEAGQLVDACTSSTPLTTLIVNDAAVSLSFLNFDDGAYRLLFPSNGSCLVSVQGGQSNAMQKLTVFLQQNYEGNCDITFDSQIRWSGKPPFIDSTAGSVTIVEILHDGSGNYYGRVIYE